MPSTSPANRLAPCIAILGTGSDVGKSIITTALCRIFANQGLRVAPFKAQNMSNNSGVTPEGLEMGRAQIVQAEAARIAPHVDMNPILLKPTSEVGSQVVLHGQSMGNFKAGQYHLKKELFFQSVCDSVDRLRQNNDIVVIEGAGSCAEVNLMDRDIVNFRIANYTSAPVILVADIHRGGVFAQIVGTLACLEPALQDRVSGFIINRFRGDISLFKEGADWISDKTGKPCLGVIPYFDHFSIEAEDSVVVEKPAPVSKTAFKDPAIGIVRLPHISNFTDFDPLFRLTGVEVYFLEKVQDISRFQALILPGSKNTRSDLEWLHNTGWSAVIKRFADAGGHILGICGGYQMLGDTVKDPEGFEGRPGQTYGLGLLSIETVLKFPKITTRVRIRWEGQTGAGYEIHMGESLRNSGVPLLEIIEKNGSSCQNPDGAKTPDGRVMGSYVHGLFESPGILKKWLSGIGLTQIPVPELFGWDARDRDFDLLAKHFMDHADMEKIFAISGITSPFI